MNDQQDWTDVFLDAITSNRAVGWMLASCVFLGGVVALIEAGR